MSRTDEPRARWWPSAPSLAVKPSESVTRPVRSPIMAAREKSPTSADHPGSARTCRVVDPVRQAFDEYRAVYPPRVPDLSRQESPDEVSSISAAEGRREFTVAPADDVLTGAVPRARGEQQGTKYLWVVGLTDVPYALESLPGRTVPARGYLAHTNLTGGAQAHAGGEMWFLDEASVVINGGSGRYPPREPEELKKVAAALSRCGYRAGFMRFDDTGLPLRFLQPGEEPEWV
jgi:hypothetical protein